MYSPLGINIPNDIIFKIRVVITRHIDIGKGEGLRNVRDQLVVTAVSFKPGEWSERTPFPCVEAYLNICSLMFGSTTTLTCKHYDFDLLSFTSLLCLTQKFKM